MKEKIRELIENMSNGELRWLWNEYCNKDNRTEDWIYDMSEFDEINKGRMPSDIALSICYGNFNPNDYYFWFDGYGNFESSDFIESKDSPFYIEELISYIIESKDFLMNDDIAEILAEEEDEEE